MTHGDKIAERLTPVDQKDFTSHRVLSQYIGVDSRLDVCANVQLAAPGTDPTTKAEYNALNKTIKHLHTTTNYARQFEPLDLETMRIIVYTDGRFSNTIEMGSQLEVVVPMADATGQCNNLQFSSLKFQ